MFEKFAQTLTEKLTRLAARAVPVDPSGFNDPRAARTDWTPLKGGGANFRTHTMIEKAHYRYEFRPSAGNLIFGLLFAVMGGGIPVAVFLGILMEDGFNDVIMLMPLVMSAVFIGIGVILVRSALKPIVFDKHSGFFWKGRVDPLSVNDRSRIKVYCELGRIEGLQLIREWVRSDKSSFYSYELNLVLDDGSRLNVVDHGNIHKLKEDAEKLARFLMVPLWDPADLSPSV
ncbi:MAG: hypothetical protein JXB03_02485 [Spirochaetales bacterium]|nr:hypothetical protein [Spirochaetales bacterium]